MTSPRYIALSWTDPTSKANAERLATIGDQELGLHPIATLPDMVVLADTKTRYIAFAGKTGAVLGTVFRRDGYEACDDGLGIDAGRDIVATSGQRLIDAYWGEYVAFLGGLKTTVVRDPTGAVPCFTSSREGVSFFFSNIEDFQRLYRISLDIDWTMVAQALAYPGLRTERTCIAGVHDVLPGTRYARAGRYWSSSPIWTPWDFAGQGRGFANRPEAIEELRSEILRTTQAWASLSASPLLELSGGIDSSIVGACLQEAGAPVTCVTLMTPDPGADERRYAQSVADHIGAQLHVVVLDPSASDVLDGSPTLRPRPFDHPLKRIIDLSLAQQRHALGADSFFGGSGGDYVLGYLGTSAPAADALLSFGPGRIFARAVGDLADLHRSTIWKAGRLAIRKAIARQQPLKPLRDFLTGDAAEVTPEDHPWLSPTGTVLPGKMEQVAALLRGQGVREGRDRGSHAPLRMPLLSQPVVEACLRVPSWMSIAGGANRSVARSAFADRLPAEIINRRTKGDFKGLNGAMFEHNRSALQDLLIGGNLERQGLLNRGEIEAYLLSTRPTTDNGFSLIMQLASIEIWTRRWASQSPASSAAASCPREAVLSSVQR
jgi:asparagine synthase (glutamine-hydrolysing)